MVAIAACQAHHRRGQQAIEFGAAFTRGHVIGVQWIGSAHFGLCLPAARSEQHSKGESQVCLLNWTSNAVGVPDKTPGSSGQSQKKAILALNTTGHIRPQAILLFISLTVHVAKFMLLQEPPVTRPCSHP